MAVQRIEYMIHAENWKSWALAQAIKEVIANARDSGGDFEVSFERGSGKRGLVNVCDTGSGFPKDYLMVGAGETKGRGQIGQFREGLKGAMCVAARNGRRFAMATTGFRLEKVAIEDVALGSNGMVIYVDFEGGSVCGTDVTIEATEAEVRAALRHFNGVRCRGIEVEECKFDGALAVCPAGRKGKVFINGALATEEELLFDYNFTEETLAPYGLEYLVEGLKSGQNRDREVIRFAEVQDAIRALLGRVTDVEILHFYMTAWRDGRRHCREYLLGREIRTNAAWREVAKQVWPGKVCQLPRHRTYDGENEREMFPSIADRGWESLPNDLPETLRGTVESFFPTVTTVHGRLHKDDEGDVDTLPKREWTPEERDCLVRLRADLMSCFSLDAAPEFRIFLRDRSQPKAVGLWWKGTLWLRRDLVNKALSSPASYADALGTTAHEFAHGRNGHAADRTRDFENVLTDMIGQLMMRLAHPEEALASAAVASAPLQGQKRRFDLTPYPQAFTYDQIVAELERVRPVQPVAEWGVAKDRKAMVAEPLEWHYLGKYTLRYKAGTQEEWHFAAHDAKGRTCHLYFRKPAHANKVVRVYGYRSTQSYHVEWLEAMVAGFAKRNNTSDRCHSFTAAECPFVTREVEKAAARV